MIALLRSDAYRVLHSRWIWGVVAIVAFLLLAPALMMRWTSMGPVRYDDLTNSALAMTGVQMLAAAMASIVCCDRTDIGFSRSILSSLGERARMVWFAEKCVFSLLLAAVLIVFVFVVGLLALPVSGVPVADLEPAWQVAAWLGCTWLCAAPYVALTVLVAQLTRNEGVTTVFAVLAAGGLLEGGIVIGIDALCYLAGGNFLDFSSAVAPWLPSQIVGIVGQGAVTLLSSDNAAHLSGAVRALIVCLPLTVAVTAVDALLVSRRDVA
ncbi:hypothetical protein INF26_08175 [Olsenella sp. DSM 107455]|uniref:ABC transporter permease n=1 Tax=Thermophilibacter gallinarum TaxID=2779357 RepID=A0ABR9QUU3_9ACTN|nr:hypothetical protein [Thermophilibacter gallinarum]MBE5024822.1 hypothetical protein [Thermophilibacter gallinarum]